MMNNEYIADYGGLISRGLDGLHRNELRGYPAHRYLRGKECLQPFIDDFGFRQSKKPVWYARVSVLSAEDFHDTFIAAKSWQHYAGAIQAIDDGIGEILSTLERKGMRDNTIVIFCADHGEMLGDHGLFQKSVLYEGALRIPLIVSIPGRQIGGESEALVGLIDLYPAILEMARWNMSLASWTENRCCRFSRGSSADIWTIKSVFLSTPE